MTHSTISLLADVPDPLYQAMQKYLDNGRMGQDELITVALSQYLMTCSQLDHPLRMQLARMSLDIQFKTFDITG